MVLQHIEKSVSEVKILHVLSSRSSLKINYILEMLIQMTVEANLFR